MRDVREQILSRLMTIFEEVPGILTAARNREDVSGKARPAIIMHDAAEDTSDLSNRPRRVTKDEMVLSPQIYILLGDKADVVGSKVSEFRNWLVNLVWTDSILKDLTGGNGDIRYTGCGLDTTTGETREARLEVRFEFTYVLDAAELV
jgi:hypothetical protein